MDSTTTKYYLQTSIARDTLVEVDLQGFIRLLQAVSHRQGALERMWVSDIDLLQNPCMTHNKIYLLEQRDLVGSVTNMTHLDLSHSVWNKSQSDWKNNICCTTAGTLVQLLGSVIFHSRSALCVLPLLIENSGCKGLSDLLQNL